jgi:ketosteroid isomerase-like protein
MTEDERVIRELINTWMTATRTGDVPTVLSLMNDDAIFMVPGQEPFGKKARDSRRAQGGLYAHHLRKQPDGRWLLARDANLMTAK